MTRVAIDCRMADWTGVGRYTTGVVRALAARGDIGIVQIVSRTDQAPVPDAPLVLAEGHPFTPAGSMSLARAIAGTNADVVHCLHFPTPIPVAHPLVVTLYDLAPLLVPGAMPSFPRRAVYRWWNARAVRKADRITTCSQYSADDLARVLGRYAPRVAERSRVVYPAADDFVAGERGELTGEVADLAQGRYVLAFASTRANKGLPVLLRAWAKIAPANPEVVLLLAGKATPEALAMIAEAQAPRVHFAGYVDDPALRTLYASAEVFAFPSTFEGFGIPPLEAMGFGTPVVTTTAASLPEVVGDAALSVPPADAAALAAALGRILADRDLAARLAEAGLARAADFSWARAAEETAAVYAEVAP